MSKTVSGLNAEYISFYEDGSAADLSILGPSGNSGIFMTMTGAAGFANAGICSLLVGVAEIDIYNPIVSSSRISCSNMTVNILGSASKDQCNYFSAACTTGSTNPVFFTYLDAPVMDCTFVPSHTYTLYVAGPPSSGVATFSVYVNSGSSYFGGGIITNQIAMNKILISGNSSSGVVYTIPDAGTNANFVLSNSASGQMIRTSYLSSSFAKGGIMSFGKDGDVIPNIVSGSTVHLNYFAGVSFSANSPALSSTVCIASQPLGSTVGYAFMVLSGTSQFSGLIELNSLGFINDNTTGLSYNSMGAFSCISQGAPVARFTADGITMPADKSLNFTNTLNMSLAGISHFSINPAGLPKIANGYVAKLTSAVSVKATVAGTGFSTTSSTLPIYYFPLGGKAYYVVISSDTSNTWKTGGTPSSSNYLSITFFDFAIINAISFEGTVGTYNTGTVATTKHVSLKGYMSGSGILNNSIVMVFPVSSALATSNLWTGTLQPLTGYFTGIIFADK